MCEHPDPNAAARPAPPPSAGSAVPRSPARVIVVGAGIIGLTCAIRLLQAGRRVDVLARDLPAETTSSVAAAIWYPYLAYPAEQVAAWGITTLRELTEQAARGVPGVVMRSGTELLATPQEDYAWAAAVPDFARLDTVPSPYLQGYRLTVPVVEMGVYLPWLRAQVEQLGGSITRMALTALPRPDADERGTGVIIVNCSGLGSYGLAQDHAMRPVRGQIVLIEQFGLDEFRLGGQDYIVPRARHRPGWNSAGRRLEPPPGRRDHSPHPESHGGDGTRPCRPHLDREGVGRPSRSATRPPPCPGGGREPPGCSRRALLRTRRFGRDAVLGMRRAGV